ncbi:hypothetical protein D3C84_724480 [compost metagenome]
MGLVVRKSKIGAEQRDLAGPHVYRQVHRRVNHTATDKQLGLGQLLAHVPIDRAGGIGHVTLALPTSQDLRINHGHVDQRDIARDIARQMSRRDTLINRDHHIRLDPMLDKRSVGRIDANEQRPLRLFAYRAQRVEVLFQAGSGGNDKHFPAGTGGKQLRSIGIGANTLDTRLQTLGNLRIVGIEFAIVEGQMGFADQPVADLGVVVVRQHQLRRQREVRQLDFRQIAGVQQHHS